MPVKYNLDHQHAVIDQLVPIVVAPGEPHEFTDEQIEAGLAGSWSDTDPREGLSDERAFKLARDTSRPDLDEQARSLGIDPADLHTKQEVAQAIQAAHDAAAQSIQDVQTEPAAEPEKE